MTNIRLAVSILTAAWAAYVPAPVTADEGTVKETEVMAETDAGVPGAAVTAPTGKTLNITWERLVAEGATCPRCGSTEAELDKAAALLRASLAPLGVAVMVEKREIALAAFQADPASSNRVWLNGRLLEDWLGGQAGQSPCCDVCGDEECRTVEVAGETHETIPADLIVRAGLAAAAALPDAPAAAPCCGSR